LVEETTLSGTGGAFLIKGPPTREVGELGVYSEWQLSTIDGGTPVGILHVYALGNNWSEGSQQRWDYFFNNGDRITVALAHGNYGSSFPVDASAFPGASSNGKVIVTPSCWTGTITQASASLSRFVGGSIDMRVISAKDNGVLLSYDCIARFVVAP
jgi:hypothetical protein